MAKDIIWTDRKRIIFGLPWTFTKYILTKEKLLVETGILNKDQEEIRLYRIMDMTLRRSLWHQPLLHRRQEFPRTGHQVGPRLGKRQGAAVRPGGSRAYGKAGLQPGVFLRQ